jgi:hypothetical protein
MTQPKKKGPENKTSTRERIQLAAIGMEAEFAVILDGVQKRPEDIFGSPKKFIREKMMHRKGRSYHLPTGGAVYFDTGVIEVATPVIEIERGCAARAGRNLWEAILFVRQELDAWEQAHDSDVALAGFSTHYNISFELPRAQQGTDKTVEQLAYLWDRRAGEDGHSRHSRFPADAAYVAQRLARALRLLPEESVRVRHR